MPKSSPSPSPSPANRKNIDWSGIQALYRLGKYSNRYIAAQFGIDEKTIRLKAKKEDWAKDLTEKVAAGIRNAVVRSYSANDPNAREEMRNAEKLEKEIVSVAIEEGKTVVLKHQDLGARLSNNASTLTDIVATRMSMPGEISAKDLNFLAGANWRAAAAAQISIGIERQSRNLDTVATDPNAPSAIHITYYRDAKIQQLKIGGNGGGRDGRS